MPDQITQAFEQLITPSLIEKFKDIFGDEPQQISDTLTAALPTVLNGIMSQAGTSGGAAKILEAAHEASDKNILANKEDIFSGGGEWMHTGGAMLTSIFGTNENHIIQKISDTTGAKKSSVHNLLIIALLLAVALLGKHVAENNLDKKGFINYLSSNVSSSPSLFPAGLSAAALGLLSNDMLKDKLHSINNSAAPATAHDPIAHEEVLPAKERVKGIVMPVIVLIFLGFLAWLLIKNKMAGETVDEVPKKDARETAAMKPSVVDTVAHTVTLPGGALFHVAKGTMEYKLAAFLDDPNNLPGKDIWFDFDNVNFDVDKATLTAESSSQLDNIAAILKAYPKTKVKVGGYTDRTGNEGHNVQLSQARADTVSNALKERAVDAGQLLGAEGYGSQFAKVPATATDNERKIDRRMALSVREK